MTDSKKSHRKNRPRWQGIGWDFAKTLGIPLVLALIIKTSVVEAYIIPSGSMEDTLLPGDYIIGNKFAYGMKLPVPFVDLKLPAIQQPKPGDIVIFKYPMDPSQNYIKRCIAVEGQTVEIRNKRVYVDGKPVPMPSEGKFIDKRIIPSQKRPRWGAAIRDNMPPVKVPEGKLFMMGDNRDNSADSRFWGFLDREYVLGRAMMVFWSWECDEPMPTSSSAVASIDMLLYNIKNFPDLVRNIRWNRLAKITN